MYKLLINNLMYLNFKFHFLIYLEFGTCIIKLNIYIIENILNLYIKEI
jgi:hypothetical protein